MNKSQTIFGKFHTFGWNLGDQVICRLTVAPESDMLPGCVDEDVGCIVIGSAVIGDADVFGSFSSPRFMFFVKPNNYKQKFWVNEDELKVGKSEEDMLVEAAVAVQEKVDAEHVGKSPLELAKELDAKREAMEVDDRPARLVPCPKVVGWHVEAF